MEKEKFNTWKRWKNGNIGGGGEKRIRREEIMKEKSYRVEKGWEDEKKKRREGKRKEWENHGRKGIRKENEREKSVCVKDEKKRKEKNT